MKVTTVLALAISVCLLAACNQEATDPVSPTSNAGGANHVTLDNGQYLIVTLGDTTGLLLEREETGYYLVQYTFDEIDARPGDIVGIVNSTGACAESYPAQCAAETVDVITAWSGDAYILIEDSGSLMTLGDIPGAYLASMSDMAMVTTDHVTQDPTGSYTLYVTDAENPDYSKLDANGVIISTSGDYEALATGALEAGFDPVIVLDSK